MGLQITNPKYNADGTIDCTWHHPTHGIIPFTASPNDCEAHGRFLFAQLVAGEYGAVAPYVAPEEA